MSTTAAPHTTAQDKLEGLKRETEALRAIRLAELLPNRYGATPDGPEVMAVVKRSGTRVKQQKYKISDGHHINVTEDNSWWDLLNSKGGKGAITAVEHLECCDFKRARDLLAEWYPNAKQLVAQMKPLPSSSVNTAEPEPEVPVVLKRFRKASKGNRNYDDDINRFLRKVRGLPADIVAQAQDRNLVYATEKTTVRLIKSPAAEKFADELSNICRKKNLPCSVRDKDYKDNSKNITVKIDGKDVPAIQLRFETDKEIAALLANPPTYTLPGSTEQMKPVIHSTRLQPELAQPILEFFTDKPIATSVRSLDSSFKQCVGPKTKGAFYWGKLTEQTRELVATESPIEAMSYAVIRRCKNDTCILGLSGTGNIDPLFEFLKLNDITVVPAFNNEGAGRKFARNLIKKAQEYGVKYRLDLPPAGEVSVEANKDPENEKYFDVLRDAARKHKVRFKEREVESPDGKQPIRLRMRIESHAEVWKLLDIEDPEVRREAREAVRTGKPTVGIAHFRETATIEPICKDWNDLVKGGPGRLFTENFKRAYDEKPENSFMMDVKPVSAPDAAAVQDPSSGPPATEAPPASPEGPDMSM